MTAQSDDGRGRRRRVPVLVLPGWGASDRSTIGLRTQLSALGHQVHRWQLGRNEGPSEELAGELAARFRQLHDRHQRPLALVGWSLGGIYAWALTQRFPDEVQTVVTLGTPLTRVDDLERPASVPLSSIWSRNDRVVDWRKSAIEEGDRRENIEVRALHATLGFDPLVMAAIADRLTQRPDRWRPFRPPPWLAPAYPPGPYRPGRHPER